MLGGYCEEVTPVPISNTAVKLFCADDTRQGESRSLPSLFSNKSSLIFSGLFLCPKLFCHKRQRPTFPLQGGEQVNAKRLGPPWAWSPARAARALPRSLRGASEAGGCSFSNSTVRNVQLANISFTEGHFFAKGNDLLFRVLYLV